MSISAHAAKLEWDYFREWGHAKEQAKDRWAITALIRLGGIEPELAQAALRFASLQEDIHQETSCSFAERVSTGRGDPHAGALKRAQAAAEIARARLAVHAGCRPDHARIFDLAFACPHPTMQQLRKASGKDHRGVERALKACLTRLWGLWR